MLRMRKKPFKHKVINVNIKYAAIQGVDLVNEIKIQQKSSTRSNRIKVKLHE